jgi:hypothetical protein
MIGWTTGGFSFGPAVPVATKPAVTLSAERILI